MFEIEKIPSGFKMATEVLSLGSETRPRISWNSGGVLFSLSQTGPSRGFADLYEAASLYLLKKFKFVPEIITFDPHPLFCCGRAAATLKAKFFPRSRLVPVFHHIAHVARFAIDEGLKKKYIGLAFDGNGYGSDGNSWGSEFFIYSGGVFSRRAHFDYMRLAGGDAATKEPWRLAAGVAFEIYGEDIFKRDTAFLKGIPKDRLRLVCQMLEKKFNIAYSSSAGRLFDAVAAMLKIKSFAPREGEAALALEAEAKRSYGAAVSYPFDIKEQKSGLCVSFLPMFKEIIQKRSFSRSERQVVSRRFHVTVASAAGRACRLLRKKFGINLVYASGGVFMNDVLCSDLKEILRSDGFKLIFAKRPFNTDLGISEGQISAICMDKSLRSGSLKCV